MKPIHVLVWFILASTLLLSCGGSDGGGGGGTPQREEDTPPGDDPGGGSESVEVAYDSELTAAERQALDESTKKLASMDIDGSRIKGFSQIFGGNRSSNVVAYLETRVNYFISEATDYRSRLTSVSRSSHNLEVFASNPSVLIWYDAKISEPEDVRFQINDRQVDINSSRIGIMQVGEIFTISDTVVQAITLVHEGRHSDCKGGALATDLERWEAGLLPEKRDCGHLHNTCPPGHPNAGGSCDMHPWGAYAVDYIYSLAIAETCDSCSETEKQLALANAFQVSQSTIFDFEATRNGDFGPADMSSSNQVR